MSFGLLAAGFLATTNAGRVALASIVAHPRPRTGGRPAARVRGSIATAVLFAEDLLDGLSISPESFRIAAGMVLAATGLRTIVWPQPVPGPFAAILITPELVLVAVSFGADESARGPSARLPSRSRSLPSRR